MIGVALTERVPRSRKTRGVRLKNIKTAERHRGNINLLVGKQSTIHDCVTVAPLQVLCSSMLTVPKTISAIPLFTVIIVPSLTYYNEYLASWTLGTYALALMRYV